MFKKIFNSQSNTITSAAIIIGATSLISRLLGVLRDRVLAGEFGASSELDMYYAAFRFPDLIFNIIIVGAISAGFIPIFTNYLKKEDRAWRLANTVINALLIMMIILSGILFLLAPWLIRLITPGFNPEQISITASLTRIMFLSPLFLGISGILSSVLQSFKRFFISSLAPIIYNVGIIIGALFFVPIFGIYGLAWGVALGAFLHMLIQIPAVWALGYRYQKVLDFKDKGFLEILKVMGPRIFGIIANQLNLFVITIIGSTLMVGSITIFNLANNLQSFPLGIFGVSFAMAAFPTLSALTNKKQEFIKVLSLTTRQTLFFIIPSAALLIVLRAQIVRIVLGSGRFDWQDTVLTLQTLSIFAVSLFAQALILLLARAFYAFHDSKTPFFVGLISAVLNIILAWALASHFSVVGLALAFSLATVFNFVLLWLILHYRLGNLDGRKIAFSTGKILIATFMLAISAQAIKYLTERFFGTATFIGITTQGFIAGLVGLIFYLFICWILKTEELFYFINSLKKKLLKKTSIPPPIEVIENN